MFDPELEQGLFPVYCEFIQQCWPELCRRLDYPVGTKHTILDLGGTLEDYRHLTDLKVLVKRPNGRHENTLAVACRWRDSRKYRIEEAWQITFRYRARGGGRTEWDKFIDGDGRLMIYGFLADPKGGSRVPEFQAVTMVDLNVVRGWVHRYVLVNGREPGRLFENGDGTAGRSLCLADLPPAAVVLTTVELWLRGIA